MSSSLIGWLITLLFVLILTGGFLVGLWRGLKRASFNLLVSVIGVLIALFITAPITGAVLNIGIVYKGTKTPLNDLILTMLYENDKIANLVDGNPNLKTFVSGLPKALASAIMFLFITILVECIFYIIYKVIACIFLKNREGQKKRKLLGGAVGLVKTFIVAIFAFMPLAGLIGFGSKLYKTTDYSIQTVNATATTERPNLLKDKFADGEKIVKGLENNLYTKCSSIFGLDNALFDYLSAVKVDGEKVYIRQDIQNAYKVVDFGYQLSKAGVKEVDYEKIKYDKVIKPIENMTDSALFSKIISPTVADVIINYQDYSFLPEGNDDIYVAIGENLTAHKATNDLGDYFKNDILSVVQTVKSLGTNGTINDILELDNKDIKQIATTLTSVSNLDSFETAVENVLKMNLVRAGIEPIAQKVIDKVIEEADDINSSTAGYDEEDWEELSDAVVNVVKDFGTIQEKIDVFETIKDPAKLLDKQANYDIMSITSSLGDLIDRVTSVKLLQNAEGKSIFNKYLEDYNIMIPSAPVKDGKGESVTITNYKGLLEFLGKPLTAIRDEGIYDLVTGDGENVLVELSAVVSKEGNENILNEILMPLYQIEMTKSMVFDELTSSVPADQLDLSKLNDYDKWDNDLKLISSLLKTTGTKMFAGQDKSCLQLVLDGELDVVLDNMTETDVEGIVAPILNALSTEPLKETLFNNLATQLGDVIGTQPSISIENVTFAGANGQTGEIVEVIKKFLAVNNLSNDGSTSVKEMNKTTVANALEAMKANAYRVELSQNQKTEDGIFKETFESFVDKVKEEYSAEFDLIKANEDYMRQLGIENFDEKSNYGKINYVTLFDILDLVEKQLSRE